MPPATLADRACVAPESVRTIIRRAFGMGLPGLRREVLDRYWEPCRPALKSRPVRDA
ncbi:MAG: hypothetical protein WBF53_09475 [Litorimonas sp.]